ncbi:tenascin-N-like [Strongylocentrotus purpuratus]|uniref:Fibronectin type-III domain-containing protein n=1 Tax=Strongylocentrotus purpuratus TaxID=7668 RepID=A0A7M7NS74_STRPU|nr:tenascin-N-like [Strongylocentrotus purpuratus]
MLFSRLWVFYTGPDGVEVQGNPTTDPTTTITGLTPGTTYNFRVESTDAAGQRVLGNVPATTDLQAQINVDGVSETSATLSWTPIPGSFFYRVFYTGPDGVEVSGNPSTDPTTTITGLTPGTTYNFRVESTDAAGQRVLGNVPATTDLQTQINVDSVTPTSATLSWTPVPGSFFYRAFYTGPDGVEQSGNPSTDPTTTITGLTPGTTYNFRVESTDAAGQRVLGNVPATTDLQTQINVDSVTPTSATLSWTPIPGSFFYRVFYTGPDGVEQSGNPSTDPTTTITGLTPGTTYDVRVESTDAAGQRVLGNVPATTEPLQTEVRVDSVTENTAVISWTPVPGSIIYQIFYTGPDGIQRVVSTTDPTTTLTGLTPGSSYDIRVQTTSSTGQQSDVGTTTTTTDLQTQINVDSVSSTSATLSWTPIPGSFFYRVFYTGPDGVEQSGNPTTDPTTTIAGLTPGTTYTFRVESTDGAGQRVLGNVLATTDLPTEVNVDSATQDSATISWTPIPNTIVYQISYTGPDGNVVTASATSETVILNGLLPATAYNVDVAALTNTVRVEVGNTVATTTALPTSVTILGTTPNTISAEWTPIQDAFIYRIDYVSADGQHTGIVTSDVPQAVISSLQPGTTYTITVLGIVPGGSVQVGSETATTDIQLDLTASVSNIQTTSFDVMLQDRPEFTYPSYRVTVSEVGGPFSVQLPATANRDGGILTVNAVGLTAGTEYNVNIQGVTSVGQLEDQVTFNEFTRPNPPINGRFSEVNGATVFLEWNPPADGRLDGYIVVHGTETQDPSTLTQAVIPLGQTSYAVSGLNPLIPYVIGLVSYRDSVENFSDFAELLQERNSNLVINREHNISTVIILTDESFISTVLILTDESFNKYLNVLSFEQLIMNVLVDLVRMVASALVNQEVDLDVNASTASAVLAVKQPQMNVPVNHAKMEELASIFQTDTYVVALLG